MPCCLIAFRAIFCLLLSLVSCLVLPFYFCLVYQYNVTGLCNRNSCPLANNRYATVREHEGQCYLYLKTVERAHSPKHMWEKIKLPRNYTQALEQISKHTEHWPSFLTHKCKQRLTKIHQYLIRMRKLAMRTAPKLVRVNKKADRRERNRERKALVAADLEKSIKKELLERLRKGTYGDIYNFPEKEYEKALEEADGEMDEMGEDLAAEEDDELEAEEFEADLDDDSEDDEVEYLEEDEFMESDDELEDAGLSFEVNHLFAVLSCAFLGKIGEEIIS